MTAGSTSGLRSARRSTRRWRRTRGCLLRRGRGRCGRRLRGHPRPVREVRPERVFDTPISELALAGAAFGAAVTGLRPVVEIMFGDFLAARHGQRREPDVEVLVPDAGRGQRAGRRSARWSAPAAASAPSTRRCRSRGSWACPGSRSSRPSTPARRQGASCGGDRGRQPGALLRAQAAVRRSRARSTARRVPLGQAAVVREGTDVTSCRRCAACTSAWRPRSSSPAGDRRRGGRPADAPPARLDTILASLEKTNRLVVVEEGPLTGGWAGEVSLSSTEQGLGDLDDAWRIATPDSPIPYSPPLEDAHLPGAERIAAEITDRLGRRRRQGAAAPQAPLRPRTAGALPYRPAAARAARADGPQPARGSPAASASPRA